MNLTYFDPTFQLPVRAEKPPATVIRKKIRAWITSPWLVDLVEMFDGTINSQEKLDNILRGLETFSVRWDFRRMARERGVPADDERALGQGAARWLTSASGLSKEAQVQILQNAERLGLVQGLEPSQSFYDFIVVLGGARLSCKLRPLRAAEVIRSGVTTRLLVLLGTSRPIPSSEREATDTYAPGAADEFDLIVAGGQQVFGFDLNTFEEDRYSHPTNSNLSWVVRYFKAFFDGRPFPIVAISAPSSDPERRRANSADTITFFLDHENVPQNSKLLLITSQIYVPYVQLEALRSLALPRKLFVETIGFPGDRMPELQRMSDATHYLQEIRSAIQAARRFCETYPE